MAAKKDQLNASKWKTTRGSLDTNPTVVRKVTVTSWSMWVTRMSLQGHPWPSMETTETAQVVEDHLEANADLHLI